jgi:hypothetical protein
VVKEIEDRPCFVWAVLNDERTDLLENQSLPDMSIRRPIDGKSAHSPGFQALAESE